MTEFSKTAYGSRVLYGGISCNADKCALIFTGEKTYKGDSLVSKTFFEAEPNTLYFLIVTGKVVPPELTNFEFGICDSEGYRLENHLDKYQKSNYVTRLGCDQTLSIKGQDGSYYTRTYAFFSGDNEKMAFWTDGTSGEVVLSDVRVFKMIDAMPLEGRKEAYPVNWVEEANTCDVDKNLVGDFEIWAKSAESCKFVDFSDGVIHYKSQDVGQYYYIVWFPIERPGIYDICFKSNVLEKGDSNFGIITQNEQGKRKFIMEKNNATKKNDTYADMYAIPEGVKVGFAVYNGGGAIDFEDFKVFFAADAKKPE